MTITKLHMWYHSQTLKENLRKLSTKQLNLCYKQLTIDVEIKANQYTERYIERVKHILSELREVMNERM